MAEIVNLRQARKAKKRADDAGQAQVNRARHGATKAQRRLTDDEAARMERKLEGARREDD